MITFITNHGFTRYLQALGCVVMIGLVNCCNSEDQPPENIVTTADIIFVGETKATGGGQIQNGGKVLVNSRGICWNTAAQPTIFHNKSVDGAGHGSFVSELTDLSPNTQYHVRAYARTAEGIIYGDEITFVTKNSLLPIVQTTPISNLTSTTAISGGTIVFEGDGNVTSRGICWSVDSPPTLKDNKTIDGEGLGSFTSTITGMDSDLSYYIRAYATNKEGTAYGNSVFVKPYKGSITDIDLNVYTTVTIGTQVWTVENLKVTKYQNGDPIDNISDNGLWNNTVTGAFCNYDNESTNSDLYGRLYNWYAINDHRNLAPKGWHVATYSDYLVLVDYLGGPFEAAEKMNNGAFKAQPGGKRNRDGVFFDQGIIPYFWTATEYHAGSAWARYVMIDEGELNIINLSKNYGFSVRCVRD